MKDTDRPKFDYRAGNPWLAFDEREEFEDCIAGNRAGLEALRDAVSAALADKEARIDFHFSHIRGVVLVEGDPRETARTSNTWKDWVAAMCSLLLAGAIAMLAFGALLYLFKLLKKFLFG